MRSGKREIAKGRRDALLGNYQKPPRGILEEKTGEEERVVGGESFNYIPLLLSTFLLLLGNPSRGMELVCTMF